MLFTHLFSQIEKGDDDDDDELRGVFWKKVFLWGKNQKNVKYIFYNDKLTKYREPLAFAKVP